MPKIRIAMLFVAIISVVAFSPQIWAIVEPHITITMEPSQTTKPFVINDDLGNEVFSVDVDGTVFPSQGFTTFEYYHEPAQIIQVVPGEPTILAKWRLTWDLPEINAQKLPILFDGGVISGEITRIDGKLPYKIGYSYYEDYAGVSFRLIGTDPYRLNDYFGTYYQTKEITTIEFFETAPAQYAGSNLDDSPYLDLVLSGFSNNASETVELRNLFASARLSLPDYVTVERII